MTDNRDYYYQRAETELKQAQRSTLPQAVQAHYAIASAYLELAYAEDEEAQAPNDS